MDKILSICIPTYNRIEKVKNQVEFLINEGVCETEEVEVVISDNASPDGTYEKYLKNINHRNICVFEQEKNVGLINNLYTVLQKATGKYSWIIGDDDILYPGIIKHVLKIFHDYPDVGYVFLNHKYVHGNVVTSESVVSCKGGYNKNGLEIFENLVRESGFGPGMFLSANIYLSSKLTEMNRILEANNEKDNMALPLAYSIYCANGAAYLVSEAMVEDQLEGASWTEQTILVHCRDMIAAINITGDNIGHGDFIRKLLMSHLPASFPELKYLKVMDKFGKSNYAWEMYSKYFPMRLTIDKIIGPIIIPLEKIRNKFKRGVIKIKKYIVQRRVLK